MLSNCLSSLLKRHHHHPSLPSTTISNHFNSLYDSSSDDSNSNSNSESTQLSTPLSSTSLSSAIASRRLIPASPGRSNSIFDSSPQLDGVSAVVALPTDSPDPYTDFRRSMEEMVVALGLHGRRNRGQLLHELLLCYLALNGRHVHKYIVLAFADLLVGLEEGYGHD